MIRDFLSTYAEKTNEVEEINDDLLDVINVEMAILGFETIEDGLMYKNHVDFYFNKNIAFYLVEEDGKIVARKIVMQNSYPQWQTTIINTVNEALEYIKESLKDNFDRIILNDDIHK